MRCAAALLALLLIAAGPQLIVQLEENQEGYTIVDYERTQGDDPTRTTGSWTLELEDTNGIVVSQTTFNPGIILPDGSTQAQETLHVSISAPATATSISLRDENYNRVSALNIRGVCGDGRCDASEQGICSQDCDQRTTELQEEQRNTQATVTQDQGFGALQITIIAAATLLIIVLIFVLLHLNRTKQNPIELQ